MAQEIQQLLSNKIPNDHSRQIASNYYVEKLLNTDKIRDDMKILDLGCGTGNSIDLFLAQNPTIKWFGLDIEDSSEVNLRTRKDAKFYSYDGINIPFEENFFDLIYSNQVFEHVRYPNQLLKQVYRVLKPNGYFIGSVSYLEPFHSRSFWNYTPYGFDVLLDEVGLTLQEIRPSIDALTLIIATGLGVPKFFGKWWQSESPLNQLITVLGKLKKLNHYQINSTKLSFCGQFCFLVIKEIN